MNKELKIELFNIYDVVVFEDENGITQDCVCDILKDKDEETEVVGVVGCNNYSISIYKNGIYRVWKKYGKGIWHTTEKKILHLYTLKNDNRFYEVYPTNDYEAIENAKPSKALKCLEKIDDIFYLNKYRTTSNRNREEYEFYPHHTKEYDIIEQTLIKEQKMEKENAKYKQLKKQLGCPLEVVVKAISNGIYVKDLPSEGTIKKFGLRLSNIETEWYLSNNIMCINLKDYKTLFWLREDKSE